MSVTLRSIIIAVCLMIAAAFLYRISNLQGQMSTEEIQARFPTFEATGFEGRVFDKDGLIKYNIASEQVLYYQERGLIEMQKPVGQYFDHNAPIKEGDTIHGQSQAPDNAHASVPFHHWEIEAEQGYMIHNQEAVLKGNVKIIPSSQEVKIQQILTPYMFYDLVANTISSKEEIIIKGEQFTDQGRDYLLDLNAKTFVIKDKPHAVYYP